MSVQNPCMPDVGLETTIEEHLRVCHLWIQMTVIHPGDLRWVSSSPTVSAPRLMMSLTFADELPSQSLPTPLQFQHDNVIVIMLDE